MYGTGNAAGEEDSYTDDGIVTYDKNENLSTELNKNDVDSIIGDVSQKLENTFQDNPSIVYKAIALRNFVLCGLR